MLAVVALASTRVVPASDAVGAVWVIGTGGRVMESGLGTGAPCVTALVGVDTATTSGTVARELGWVVGVVDDDGGTLRAPNMPALAALAIA